MEQPTSPKKKLKSPGVDVTANINIKTSVTCANVPEILFDATVAKKHFSKFGRVQKIRLFPRKHMCIIEYDQPMSAERAVLNAGAYDGFMFDVTRTKARVRRKSKREDDPDWVPDADVEAELSAMSGSPSYRVTRQKPMDVESPEADKFKLVKKQLKQPIKTKAPVQVKKPIVCQPATSIEPVVVIPTSQTSMSTSEAAVELHQLRSRVSMTPDEQWRTLDARDRILRAWGGAGSRVKIGGATIGTCPDMCPEKELLHRQAEHQVMTLETVPGSDGELEARRAVKQYSRSSADQEIPMCYELRPPPVLMRTCAYLLHEIADTKRQVTLADWFHFMWDRLRGIRKDITQQALCCAESIRLMEMCARFHAHCAARLADLEHTQFDQKLNTDNLTKCLQTLKHMYTDVGPDMKPCEAEFRGYIALLNLGDSNFWWEIQQLPLQIQKSESIVFAIKVFNALDNNNYVRFFRLVKEEATYFQACILLRYFNDVRARALARIVKAYAPRGGSRYPAEDLIKTLRFETVESMRSFITHYGLRFGKDETELVVILDRNQFIEDSDPYPIARSIQLIESKRKCSVGEVIAGGLLPDYNYANHVLYSSFVNGVLKESALTAEDQGYNTKNDSNKNVQALKMEIQRLWQGGRAYAIPDRSEPKANIFVKPDTRISSPGKSSNIPPKTVVSQSKDSSMSKSFSFKPAIPVAPTEVIKNSPEKIFGSDTKPIFSFSKPQDTVATNNVFAGKATTGNSLFAPKQTQAADNLFGNKDPFQNSQKLFKKPDGENVFKKPDTSKAIFGQAATGSNNGDINRNLFTGQNAFGSTNIFAKNKDESNSDNNKNIFTRTLNDQDTTNSKNPSSVFGSFNKSNAFSNSNNIFANPDQNEVKTKPVFPSNGDISPGTLFKSANSAEVKGYTMFPSKNKAPSVADNIFNSINTPQSNVYEFQNDDQEDQLKQQRLDEERQQEIERKRQQKIREEEERKQQELKRQEEERRKEEERQKQLELKRIEEKRRKEEERKQEELRKKLEEERKTEMKRKAEEEERKFQERVEKESSELVEELTGEVNDVTVTDILKEENAILKSLMSYAETVTKEICQELSDEISQSEMKAEKFWTEKLMRKWFYIWKSQFYRNSKRRCLLDDTPVWLPDKTPAEEAACLRRLVESATLKNMNAIHRGYKFNGELKQWPSPEPFNIVDIIRSSLLKRMKQIGYPYDKCFFFKVTLVSPGEMKWMCKKIEIEKWLLDAFSDKKKHETSESLIHVEKQSWNHLMDFAVSVSLISPHRKTNCTEAMEGANGILFYVTECDQNLCKTVEETIKQKYPYQIIPVTVIMPKNQDEKYTAVEQLLTALVDKQMISAFKIFTVDSENIFDSMGATTKSALKWMAKKYPCIPPLEVDYLKSICERYLGNEIWCRLRSATDGRMKLVLKDLQKLVKCYNIAVDKLTDAITNEDLFNYPSFPLEFNDNLDHTSPYPKPFEFIPTNAKNSDNISAIRDMMRKLKLPDPVVQFQPIDVASMQSQMRKYCNQIGWCEDPERVVCKIVARLPNQFTELDMSCEQFSQHFEQYDLVDFLNILVYEKINGLQNFENRFAVYEKSVLEAYRNIHWLYEIEVLTKMKHKPIDDIDYIDMIIDAKRRKIAMDSMEYLMLEDNDCTMVEENIKAANESISQISNCKDAVKQLEEQIELERKKSMELEYLLKSALSNV